MILYAMTATFGKLEHQTLSLRPGLNILQAPNEWGKSTWCAFLTAMLYGLETRAKSTKTALADKEKYAPWSGHPMEGRIELNWNGRDITIERRTVGRTPLGRFRAFETQTGMDVPELDGSNCGQMLLGIERSVFVRSCFIRQADLPVTQDENLRHRLNALVTTGDDSGTAEQLSKKLRDLKNQCRSRQRGLLPQAVEELRRLEETLGKLLALNAEQKRIQIRLQELNDRSDALANHQAALSYARFQADTARIQQAESELHHARQQEEALEFSCRDIPSEEDAEKQVALLSKLYAQQQALSSQSRSLPPMPQKPDTPAPFLNIPPEKAPEKAEADRARSLWLSRRIRQKLLLPWALTLILLLAGAGMAAAKLPGAMQALIGGAGMGIVALVLQLVHNRRVAVCRKELSALVQDYGSVPSQDWPAVAQDYMRRSADYQRTCTQQAAVEKDLEQRTAALDAEAEKITGGQALSAYLGQWQQVLQAWQSCRETRQNRIRLENQVAQLSAVVRAVPAPQLADTLTLSEEETQRMLQECTAQRQQYQLLLGQCQGKMEALGDPASLSKQIETLKGRIAHLEQIYDATEIAQQALTQATTELQRRFSPRISSHAQALFRELTGGRYQQIRLGEDLSLSAAAQEEGTLHSILWRSDGTADQLYLALRLAVCEALAPDAPLILDDALIRFDDARLSSAMTILQQVARSRQVLLFTCQGRESKSV